GLPWGGAGLAAAGEGIDAQQPELRTGGLRLCRSPRLGEGGALAEKVLRGAGPGELAASQGGPKLTGRRGQEPGRRRRVLRRRRRKRRASRRAAPLRGAAGGEQRPGGDRAGLPRSTAGMGAQQHRPQAPVPRVLGLSGAWEREGAGAKSLAGDGGLGVPSGRHQFRGPHQRGGGERQRRGLRPGPFPPGGGERCQTHAAAAQFHAEGVCESGRRGECEGLVSEDPLGLLEAQHLVLQPSAGRLCHLQHVRSAGDPEDHARQWFGARRLQPLDGLGEVG
ncbi:unnamed protein product, partial [Effrenium voratum]